MRSEPTWVNVPKTWTEASYRLTRTCQNDCESSSASREAFSALLESVQAATREMALVRKDGTLVDGDIVITQAYRDAVVALVDAIRSDCEASTASLETYSVFLNELDEAIAEAAGDDDLMSVKKFLESGHALDYALKSRKVSERAVIAVLERAVQGTSAKTLKFVFDGSPDDGIERCRTPFGIYEVQQLHRGTLASFYYGNSFRRLMDRVGTTREQAVAACQSDFNNRVRECLANPGRAPLEPVLPGSIPSPPTTTPARRRARP
tara:strand:+ start:2695 stop:3486 length:792 start_codon:yes stop_codon:yes gene_type:complete